MLGCVSLLEIKQHIFTLNVQDIGKYQNKRRHIYMYIYSNIYMFLMFKRIMIICSRERIVCNNSLRLTALQGSADDRKTPNS